MAPNLGKVPLFIETQSSSKLTLGNFKIGSGCLGGFAFDASIFMNIVKRPLQTLGHGAHSHCFTPTSFKIGTMGCNQKPRVHPLGEILLLQ